MKKLALASGLCSGLLSLPLIAQVPPAAEPVALKYGVVDPATQPVDVAAALRGAADTNLWIVQLAGTPTEAMRAGIRAHGGEIHSYLPENAYVVRMPLGSAVDVSQQRDVRGVTHYHPAFRIEPFVRAELRNGTAPRRSYNIVVVDKHRDKPSLARRITAIGGRIDDEGGGSLLFQVTLDAAQLLLAARFDEVLWIDRWGAPEDDMNNARIQGGADYIEGIGGYSGAGITGHQMEGLDPSHRDWNLTPIGFPAGCTAVSGHGHNTAGIVYGNGTSSPLARGMAPDAQAVFTSCRTNRWNNLQSLISTHGIMFTTASWGSPRTRQYTSVSAEADDICFDHDLVWSNSQSNAGNQDSRAEAWGKNVFAIGGVAHSNNSNPADDSWQRGSASIGPAADGRTKPDLTAYYDGIATSQTGGGFTSSFGGTSGATPIVAGHNALAIQMFTDAVFGNTLRVPGGTRFQNKPHFPTLKALQMANSAQYPFTSSSTDNLREHQGYGFPDLRSMWDNRNVMFIVDEIDVIKQGEGMSYSLAVPAGRSTLNISMSYADTAGNPAAAMARINDLTLRVTSPSGTRYWGNNGLLSGNWSIPGGSRDRLNSAENVYVQSPEPGDWTVEVIAYLVAEDTHVETAEVDADYGLVVNGATFVSKTPITVQIGQISDFGQGCVGSAQLPVYCASNNANGGTLTNETRSYEYAYQATTTNSGAVVTGFELWTGSTSAAAVNAQAKIYLEVGGRPANPAAATTTMVVGATQGFYTATFASPVTIPANSTFFVSLVHNNTTYISSLTSGASSPGYYLSGSWQRSSIATEPSFRVLCQGAGGLATPTFGLNGEAEIGQTLTADLRMAAANAPAGLMIGRSNTTWGGQPLPYGFAALGSPNCNLYVSIDAMLPFTTDGNGAATGPVAIPANPTLIGGSAYFQFVVVDPAASNFGLVFTNASAISIGG